jgi:type VI secretion system ImpC/EvpB family protein
MNQAAEESNAMSTPAEESLLESVPAADGQVPQRQTTLLDDVLASQSVAGSRLPRSLAQFLSSSTVGEALELWTGSQPSGSPQDLARRLNRDIAVIDSYLNSQLNAIMHAPPFQRLESAWRGLDYLVNVAERERDPAGSELAIKLLDVSWRELEKDFEGVFTIEQSALFQKVYEQEFGTAGGKPFGLLIGDYAIRPGPNEHNPHNDIEVLGYLSQVAAAAFCPFISNASAELFELEKFGDLELTALDHERTFGKREYMAWRSLREREDSRFIGLALPRILMRLPYRDDNQRVDRFRFQEVVHTNDESYLWGGAAFAFAGTVIRSFCKTGWLADIRGVQRDIEAGGLVTDLPCDGFATDSHGVAPKFSTDVVVTDNMEKGLADLGFIPLCACHDSEYSAFYSVQSIQKPKQYDKPIANVNATISAMIHTMLCASRFAHYLKVIGRDNVGGFKEAKDLERLLQNWISGYVTGDSTASPEIKAEYPLREASVRIRPVPGKSGVFHSVFHLCPHYEIDGLIAGIRLVTELR